MKKIISIAVTIVLLASLLTFVIIENKDVFSNDLTVYIRDMFSSDINPDMYEITDKDSSADRNNTFALENETLKVTVSDYRFTKSLDSDIDCNFVNYFSEEEEKLISGDQQSEYSYLIIDLSIDYLEDLPKTVLLNGIYVIYKEEPHIMKELRYCSQASQNISHDRFSYDFSTGESISSKFVFILKDSEVKEYTPALILDLKGDFGWGEDVKLHTLDMVSEESHASNN